MPATDPPGGRLYVEAEVSRRYAQKIADQVDIAGGQWLVTPQTEGLEARQRRQASELVLYALRQLTQSRSVPDRPMPTGRGLEAVNDVRLGGAFTEAVSGALHETDDKA